MIRLPAIHFDCKYFEGDKPCFANKQHGVFCDNCNYYEKNAESVLQFPEIPEGKALSGDNKQKKILIIKLDAAGDVLRTTSILPSLKKLFPSSIISWVTKSKSSPVLEGNPLIDSIYLVEEDLNEVIFGSFDIAINLDSGTASCKIMEKISSADKYGYTLANGKPYPLNSFANEWYLMGINDNFKKQNIKTYHKIIHEICNLKYTKTHPLLEINEGRRIKSAQIREKFKLGNYEEFILINLGGGNRWQYKKWTKEGYTELINKLSLKKSNSAIGLIAGTDDKEFYSDVLSSVNKSDNVIPLGCENTVEEFICIIFLSDKIFTSDSLALHIATALSKYVIAITGPTSHTELDVFGNGAIIYSTKVDCLTCYLNVCDKIVTCMNTIGAKDVIDYFL